MMTSTYCRKCGYIKTIKRRCIWCTSDMDTLSALSEADMDLLQKRFANLAVQTRVNYIVALGLEGFTPDEISSITHKPVGQIEILLVHAGVIGQ